MDYLSLISAYFAAVKNCKGDDEARSMAVESIALYLESCIDDFEIEVENAKKLADNIKECIMALGGGSASLDAKCGALEIMQKIASISYCDTSMRVSDLCTCVRSIVSTTDNAAVISKAALALDAIIKASGLQCVDIFDSEIKRYSEWLLTDRKLVSVIILREFCLAAPFAFISNVYSLIDSILPFLTDKQAILRKESFLTLCACRKLIQEREKTEKCALVDEKFQTFWKTCSSKLSSTESLQGGLYAISTILIYSSILSDDVRKNMTEILFKYLNEKRHKQFVLRLLPFITLPSEYIPKLLDVASTGEFKALSAISRIIETNQIESSQHYDNIIFTVQQALTKSCPVEALECVIVLARKISILKVKALIPGILTGELSPFLLNAIQELSEIIPSDEVSLKTELLNMILKVVRDTDLIQKSISDILSSSNAPSPDAQIKEHIKLDLTFFKKLQDVFSYAINEQSGLQTSTVNTIILALKALSSIDFSCCTIDLLESTVAAISPFLFHPSAKIRMETGVSCCILLKSILELCYSSSSLTVISSNSKVIQKNQEYIQQIVTAVINDSVISVRIAILKHIFNCFDPFLARPACLKSLLILVNDESFKVRKLTIKIVGRLSQTNPSLVLPFLRKLLAQIFVELQSSLKTHHIQENALLLATLLKTAGNFMPDYTETIIAVILSQIHSSSAKVILAIDKVLKEVSQVPQSLPYLIEHKDDVLSHFNTSICIQNSVIRRNVNRDIIYEAFRRFVQVSNYVIVPFYENPTLIDNLMLNLSNDRNSLSISALLGTFGAIAPDLLRAKLPQFEFNEKLQNNQNNQNQVSQPFQDGSPITVRDNYSSVVISAALKIIVDPSLPHHHASALFVISRSFSSLEPSERKRVLPSLMSSLLSAYKTCKIPFKENLINFFSKLVELLNSEFEPYIDSVFQCIFDHWDSSLILSILSLAEISVVKMNDAFKIHLNKLIPILLQELLQSLDLFDNYTSVLPIQLANIRGSFNNSTSPRKVPKKYTYETKILNSLLIFGSSLEDHLYIVVPSLLFIITNYLNNEIILPATIYILGRLGRSLSLEDYLSRIVHTLIRCLSSDKNFKASNDLIMNLFCSLLVQQSVNMLIFAPTIQRTLRYLGITHPKFSDLVRKLFNGVQLTVNDDPIPEITEKSYIQIESNPSELNLKKLNVSSEKIKSLVEMTLNKTVSDNWIEWHRQFCLAFIRESSSPEIRACLHLATDYHPLLRELFNAAFLSVYLEVSETLKHQLCSCLQNVMLIDIIPQEILNSFLCLAEFMEHEHNPLFIENLGDFAKKNSALAKTLRYKEMEFEPFDSSKIEVAEEIIYCNNQMKLSDAAVGILQYLKKYNEISLPETWHESLGRWDDAYEIYLKKLENSDLFSSLPYALGLIRSLNALGKWEELAQTISSFESQCLEYKASHTPITDSPKSSKHKTISDEIDAFLKDISPYGVNAMWYLNRWNEMKVFSEKLDPKSLDYTFANAALSIHDNNFQKAREYINLSWKIGCNNFSALARESYDRRYSTFIPLQQIAELEEALEFKEKIYNSQKLTSIRSLGDNDGFFGLDEDEEKEKLKTLWNKRLYGVKQDIETWQKFINIRGLVFSPQEDIDLFVKFAELCRRNGRLDIAKKTLSRFIISNEQEKITKDELLSCKFPKVILSYIKCLWAESQDNENIELLKQLWKNVRQSSDDKLKGTIALHLSKYQFAVAQISDSLNKDIVSFVLKTIKAAISMRSNWYKGFHNYALIASEIYSYYENNGGDQEMITNGIASVIRALIRAISLSSDQKIQDILRLLTLMFKYGKYRQVEAAIREGYQNISLSMWVQVIPQIIARIHSSFKGIRALTKEILISIAKVHPQSLVYALAVASKSSSSSKQNVSKEIMDIIQQTSPLLVHHVKTVSEELISISIILHEQWREAIEEASRCYYYNHDSEGMLNTLIPLHESLANQTFFTRRQIEFKESFGSELQEAYEWMKKFQSSKSIFDLTQAWSIYYNVFKRLNKQIPQITVLNLIDVSPQLFNLKDTVLAIPGTYRPSNSKNVITIQRFLPLLNIINSKQRPRKLGMCGSNGKDYNFLLKGHEDLRQDERVMQLFSLINSLLVNNHETIKDRLRLGTYDVVPLSPNSGLIAWIEDADTLYKIIADNRNQNNINIIIEQKFIKESCIDFEKLTLFQKLEIFKQACSKTDGLELKRHLWNQSSNSDIWIEKRLTFTRSIALMSMVGHILGLGDRHPQNLMLDRKSGLVYHIDFGDCFEVAMHRDRFPEKVPFRLTRMLISAMEVSRIEGTYRMTCERVMNLLRLNKDSLMAVLETFVYDPLINWRLVHKVSEFSQNPSTQDEHGLNFLLEEVITDFTKTPAHKKPFKKNAKNNENEAMNEKAVSVVRRINMKLTGREFNTRLPFDVKTQVDHLITQATLDENLAQSYLGWFPFW